MESAHNHAHRHGGGAMHGHSHAVTSLDTAFTIGIVLNLLFVATEFTAGFVYDSLGLLSDAGHNLSDVASLVLAMLAFRLAKVRPNARFTYGYKKSTVLVSLLNAVILLVAVGVIVSESIGKLMHPQPVEGGAIAWVAGIGVVVNAVTAWLFLKDKERDLNVRGAFLHMAADTLVSVGVVVSGIVIAYTGWYVIDPVVGLLIAGIIVWSTWSLLHDSLRLSLDGVPVALRTEDVKALIDAVPGVRESHHLHIWAISTTETALTAHIVLADAGRMESVKQAVKEQLREAGIDHATLEFETTVDRCRQEGCC